VLVRVISAHYFILLVTLAENLPNNAYFILFNNS